MNIKEQVNELKKKTVKRWQNIAVEKILDLLSEMSKQGFFMPTQIKMPHYENYEQFQVFKERMLEFGLKVECVDKKHWLEITIY